MTHDCGDRTLSWDEFFMGAALLAARRSKDPNTKVGACVVSPERRIVSTGYNGFPDSGGDAHPGAEKGAASLPWARAAEDPLDTKYPYVVHAELNAILNAGHRLAGCTLYVVLFPCNECAKAIIQSGIREVVYLRNDRDDVAHAAARRMFIEMGVKCRCVEHDVEEIVLSFGARHSDHRFEE